jgi:peptidoglycan/xylan/chitin deacetylase (PgdA/CDA1 family)
MWANQNKKTFVILSGSIIILFLLTTADLYSQTEILKWKDGKSACVSITYDDGTRNQFKIAVPIMDELGFPGTFFINTGYFYGSKYYPTFVGRPIMEILKESETVPTSQANIFERTSMIRYLRDISNVPEINAYDMQRIGSSLERGRYERVYTTVDEICDTLRKTNRTYEAVPIRLSAGKDSTTWEELIEFSKKGHEFACHTISHAHLSNLDKENILYELVKCTEDIEDHLGFRHTLSVECPYGTHDERVLNIASPLFPFMRNSSPEDYIDEILRGSSRMPGKTDKEYIQWQRGPLSGTPYSNMTSWIDTSIQYNVWLVLVFHGIEGIGWEALSAGTIQNYFNYMKSKEEDIWVATFQDGYKYIRERMNSKVNESVDKGIIVVEVSNELDKKIYDLPLTLRTEIPEDWDSVQFQHGSSIKVINSIAEGETRYVIYDIMPDSAPVRLSKASPASRQLFSPVSSYN